MAFKMNYSKGGFPFKKEKEYEPQTETRKDESTDIIPQTVRDKIEGSHREGQYVPTEERQEEIKKFLRDVEQQNCSGLFLSQNFGIAGKEMHQIGSKSIEHQNMVSQNLKIFRCAAL